MEFLNDILEEIFNIKRNTSFVFNDYFIKYHVAESEKFTLYRQLMLMLGGYVEIQQGYESNGFVEVISRYKNQTVGLPYNLPHIKLK